MNILNSPIVTVLLFVVVVLFIVNFVYQIVKGNQKKRELMKTFDEAQEKIKEAEKKLDDYRRKLQADMARAQMKKGGK